MEIQVLLQSLEIKPEQELDTKQRKLIVGYVNSLEHTVAELLRLLYATDKPKRMDA